MMGHPLAIRGVRRLSWLFFFIKFNVEMIYLNGECRAIYPRLSRGHDFAGLFSTLGIKEVFKMALERPENFIPKFWRDSLTVLSYIEMVYNLKQENPSWNCFWVSPARMFQWSHLFEFGVTCCMLSTCHVSSRIVQLSYTVAAPWLYKKWFMITQWGRLLLELLHWYPVIWWSL